MLKKPLWSIIFFLAACTVWGEEDIKQQPSLKFFSLDLHVSVVEDLKEVFSFFGHTITSWNISSSGEFFGKSQAFTEIINASTWKNINDELCDAFYDHYKGFLEQFDGYLCTYTAPLARIFAKANKPVIILNPTRYEYPFTGKPVLWNALNQFLINRHKENLLFVVSNNKGDREYLKHYTGIDHPAIPSLCNYIPATYTGIKEQFVIQASNCFLRKYPLTHLFGNTISVLSSPYSWADLYSFKGVIIIPYNISIMKIFEMYTANVPLFFPSKKFLMQLVRQGHFKDGVLNQLSFYQIPSSNTPWHYKNKTADIKTYDTSSTWPADPNAVYLDKVVKHWIELADFYDSENMPYIQYFDSFDELLSLLQTVDCKKISNQMKAFNKIRREKIIASWASVFQKIMENPSIKL